MAKNELTTVLIGDVCGSIGVSSLLLNLNAITKKYRSDLVIVNAENADGGFGLSVANARELFSAGVNVITSGNHIWQNDELVKDLDNYQNLLRPINYPSKVPGNGYTVYNTKKGDVVVLNVQGRQNMPVIDCPFTVMKKNIANLRSKSKTIIVDMHAESSKEKEAMACYLDGQITVLVGTHTHVQTADERIFKNGTAYITDLGFTGPINSVIGSDISVAIKRQLTQMPIKTYVADGPAVICGVVVKSDLDTGKALSIERFQYKGI